MLLRQRTRGLHMDFIEPVDAAPVEVSAPAESADRSYVRQDGTMVINILVPQPCVPADDGDEIVVCAPDSAGDRIPGADGTFTEEGFKPEIQVAPNVKAKARAETDPMSGADRAMIDLTYRF